MSTIIDTKNLKEIIINSQKCQRNWDLTKNILPDHIDILKSAVMNCPSKQNRTFYKCIFIMNRKVIEKIHNSSDSFVWQYEPRKSVTNSQTLANLLVVFVRDRDMTVTEPRTEAEYFQGLLDGKTTDDENKSVGIAAGSLNLTAHLLGYQTGFYNAQHNSEILNEIFFSKVFCMLGIGFSDSTKDRKQHHLTDFVYPSFKKNIKIEEMR